MDDCGPVLTQMLYFGACAEVQQVKWFILLLLHMFSIALFSPSQVLRLSHGACSYLGHISRVTRATATKARCESSTSGTARVPGPTLRSRGDQSRRYRPRGRSAVPSAAGPTVARKDGVRLAQKMQVTWPMDSCGNTAIKDWSWSSFWAN
jgi:hypothetical protein